MPGMTCPIYLHVDLACFDLIFIHNCMQGGPPKGGLNHVMDDYSLHDVCNKVLDYNALHDPLNHFMNQVWLS